VSAEAPAPAARRTDVSPWWMAAPTVLIVLTFFGPSTETKNAVYDSGIVAAGLVTNAFFVVYALAAAAVSRADVAAALGLRRTALGRALKLGLPILLAIIAVNAALEPITNAGEEQGIAPTREPRDDELDVLAAAVVTFGVVTPFAEELLFRGLGFAAFGRYALPTTAALFALAHGLPELLIPVFLAGLALGWLRQRTGSIWPGVGVHAALNTTALAVALATA
jgi:uncharacterized protein